MYYPKFIPPKDDDVDYNPMIEQQIEDMIFSSNDDLFHENMWDLQDRYDDPDDLTDVL